MSDVPVALALVAGAVAAVNPCGFALLPAYLAVLVTADDGGGRAAVVRAVRFAAGMTVGFVAVFGLFGAVVAPLALAVERYLPYVTVVVGAVLVAMGLLVLSGRSLPAPRLAGRGRAPSQGWLSQVSYGVTFALASLSCTVGPFLAVTSTALREGSVPGVVLTFVAYAVGMGAVVLVVALAAATARASVVARVRQAGPYVARVGGVLLLVAGCYVTWYGVYELRVLSGRATTDPLVSAVTDVQSRVTLWISELGAARLVAVAVACLVVVAVTVGHRKRGKAPQPR